MKKQTYEEWIGQIFSGFSQGFSLFSALESGALTYLRENSDRSVSAEEISEKLNLNLRVLEGILKTIALSESEIIEIHPDGRFSFGANGIWAFREGSLGLSQIFVGGYSNVLSNLYSTLTGELIYGKDYARNSKWVAEGTFTFTKILSPFIVAELKKNPNQTILDLGCGTGRLLLQYLQQIDGLSAIGLDISSDSIKMARTLAVSNELQKRLTFIEGDVFDIEKIQDLKNAKVSTICAHFLLHEFLYEKNNRLSQLLNVLKINYSGAQLICAEFNALDTAAYKSIPIEQRMPMLTYQHLIHTVTDQGMPMSVPAWSDYFSKNGIVVERVKTLSNRQVSVYFLRI